MGVDSCRKGLAFIVEGATEKVFYLEYLEQLCRKRGISLTKEDDSQEDMYIIGAKAGDIILMFDSVDSVSQMTNAATWFRRACHTEYPEIPWTVFLCYDTDNYNAEITKFYEGDWKVLRDSIAKCATEVVDLAAEADIEDIVLFDLPGVLGYLGLPLDTPVPDGNKGKAKLKKLFRKVAINNAYHSGERARPLIQSLDMETIKKAAPIDLESIDGAI